MLSAGFWNDKPVLTHSATIVETPRAACELKWT